MLDYFQGSPAIWVPENLKRGVTTVNHEKKEIKTYPAERALSAFLIRFLAPLQALRDRAGDRQTRQRQRDRHGSKFVLRFHHGRTDDTQSTVPRFGHATSKAVSRAKVRRPGARCGDSLRSPSEKASKHLHRRLRGSDLVARDAAQPPSVSSELHRTKHPQS
jgi:hypothetical protein